jgi:hypothetical protein
MANELKPQPDNVFLRGAGFFAGRDTLRSRRPSTSLGYETKSHPEAGNRCVHSPISDTASWKQHPACIAEEPPQKVIFSAAELST